MPLRSLEFVLPDTVPGNILQLLPRSSVATEAAGEGINLQFCRLMINYDLPWNPIDVEQRIGRIHRYGQAFTAQVYNLVSADTIDGKIFLLLEEKLLEIGTAVASEQLETRN